MFYIEEIEIKCLFSLKQKEKEKGKI